MGREVFLVRDGAVVWRGVVEIKQRREGASARDYFVEAWQRALSENAVSEADAGVVQFRFAAPA